MGICRGAFLRTTYVRLERVVLAVGICMETCIETLKWAYTERHFLEPRMCVWRGCPLQWAYVWKRVETLKWAYTWAFLRTTFLRLGRGVLAMGICTEACVEALTWAYTEGHF